MLATTVFIKTEPCGKIRAWGTSVLLWDTVDNSASLCECMSGWFSPHPTSQAEYLIL